MLSTQTISKVSLKAVGEWSTKVLSISDTTGVGRGVKSCTFGLSNGTSLGSIFHTSVNAGSADRDLIHCFSQDSQLWSSAQVTGTSNIFYENGKFFLAYDQGSNTRFHYSANGVYWTENGVSAVSGSVPNLAYGAGLYVCGGSNGLMYSTPNLATPGAIWTSQTSGFGSTAINSIAFGGGQFVAVGDSGKISASSDGSSWTTKTSGTSNKLNKVVYGGSNFFVVGNSGTLLYSSDANTWTSVDVSGIFGSTNLVTASFGNGVVLAVSGLGKSAFSLDGLTWFDGGTIPNSTINCSCYGNSLFMVGGDTTTTTHSVYTWAGQPIPNSYLSVRGANADGFQVGDTVDNGESGPSLAMGVITSITSSFVVVYPGSPNWQVGQNLNK